MRTLRVALAASRVAFEQSEIIGWTKVVATVLATTTMVLGASFLAVALSLT
jgi:preprotein translocase subunit SecG